MVKLTPKQDAFVKAYLLNGGNATQAAVEAGYSKKTANEQGSQNLAKLSIKEAIKEHQKAANKSFIWSKEVKLKLIQEVAENCMDKDDSDKMNNPQAFMSAIKEHNLMQGDNAPIVTDSTQDQSIKISFTDV